MVTKKNADPARKKNFSVRKHAAMRKRPHCMQRSVTAVFTRTLSMMNSMPFQLSRRVVERQIRMGGAIPRMCACAYDMNTRMRI